MALSSNVRAGREGPEHHRRVFGQQRLSVVLETRSGLGEEVWPEARSLAGDPHANHRVTDG